MPHPRIRALLQLHLRLLPLPHRRQPPPPPRPFQSQESAAMLRNSNSSRIWCNAVTGRRQPPRGLNRRPSLVGMASPPVLAVARADIVASSSRSSKSRATRTGPPLLRRRSRPLPLPRFRLRLRLRRSPQLRPLQGRPHRLPLLLRPSRLRATSPLPGPPDQLRPGSTLLLPPPCRFARLRRSSTTETAAVRRPRSRSNSDRSRRLGATRSVRVRVRLRQVRKLLAFSG